MSEITKRATAWKWVYGILSFLCNFGLVIAFFIWGLIEGTQTTKYTMALAGTVGVILSLVSVIFKFHWRTPLIVMIGAMYFCMQRFEPVLATIAVSIVLDELWFYPMYKHYKTKATINKEIDVRL